MMEMVESLDAAADFAVGYAVQTLKGSTRGAITRILEDGRVAWRPDGTGLELVALPESLKRL